MVARSWKCRIPSPGLCRMQAMVTQGDQNCIWRSLGVKTSLHFASWFRLGAGPIFFIHVALFSKTIRAILQNLKMSIKWAIVLIYLQFSRLIAADCYWPDGNLTTAYWGRLNACNNGPDPDGYNMCCNFASDCQKNGLCQISSQPLLFRRMGCTDSSWESKNCLKLCINGNGATILSACYFSLLTKWYML